MASNEVTVTVHLNIDLNGEPITRVLNMPASIAPFDKQDGIHIYLDLSARALADALLPYVVPMLGLDDK